MSTYRRWWGQQYGGKCSFYFNCYFFHTTPTNRDLREKAVYFPLPLLHCSTFSPLLPPNSSTSSSASAPHTPYLSRISLSSPHSMTKCWTVSSPAPHSWQSTARFGKSTHISMISNSVTHLRSYANSAIADIAENSAPESPVTPRDRRCLRIERRYRRIERPPRDVLRCITMFYMCFMVLYYIKQCFMFSESRNDRRRRIGGRRSPQGSRQRRRDRR